MTTMTSKETITIFHRKFTKLDSLFVSGSVKRGLIADPNCIYYLETHNLTCKFGTTLKLGHKVPLTYHNNLV